MKTINFICPKCKKTFSYSSYLKWILAAPFHYFGKRKTKCPHCLEYSWVRGLK